jgi:hypothetical protein
MSARASGIETFGIDAFAAALVDFPTARCIGLRKGEYVWVIPVVPDGAVGIHIRSTIRADGMSADAGADSIRAWIGRIPDGAPWAPKGNERWTTRKHGWDARLCRVIEELLVLARYIRPCPACEVWMKLREGPATVESPSGLMLHCDARAEGTVYFDAAGVPMEIPGSKCGTQLAVIQRVTAAPAVT